MQFPNDPGIVNVSHIIKSVSFGPSFPGQVNPLDGTSFPNADTASVVFCMSKTLTGAVAVHIAGFCAFFVNFLECTSPGDV